MSYNQNSNNYKCIGIEIIGRNNLINESQCYFAKVYLENTNSNERKPSIKSLEITLNGSGLNKAIDKVRRELIAKKIEFPKNLRELTKPYQE